MRKYLLCLFLLLMIGLVGCGKPEYVYFYNYDGSLLYRAQYDEDRVLTYDGLEPVREDDDIYTYKFSGWNHELTEAAQYKNFFAVYEKDFKTFTVEFYNYDKTFLFKTVAKYGHAVDAIPENPKRDGGLRNKYYFAGWGDVDLGYITKDTKCYAQYTNVECFEVQYRDIDDTLIATEYIEKGLGSDFVTNIVKEANENEFYVFSNWSEPVSNVTSDMVVYAEYKTVEACTVTFLNHDGTVLKTEKVPKGSDVEYYGTNPYKPSYQSGDYIYSYTFSGWSSSLNNITTDITVQAQFNSSVKVTGKTAIKQHLDSYGSGSYNEVDTAAGSTLGYSGSYFYVSYENTGDLYSKIVINFEYGDSYGYAVFQIKDGSRVMYQANMTCHVSGHQFYTLKVISIDVCRYTNAQLEAVAALSLLAAKFAVNNASDYLSRNGLPYIY